jgi:hypothetical protein
VATDAPSRFGLTGIVAVVGCVLLAALLTNHMHVVLGIDAGPESSLPVPTVWVILLLVGLNGLVAWMRRGKGLLSRAQLVLVACGALMAAPLLSQGFWMRFVGTVTSYPRENQFWVIDAMPDKLWPHGANLLAGKLPAAQAVEAASPLILRVAVGADGAVPAKPYLVSALVKADGLPEGTVLVCSVAGNGGSLEAFRLDRPGKPDQVRGDGFQRLGIYGLRLPDAAGELELRFDLRGPGRVEVADPKLMSVAAVEAALRGARPVTAEVMAQLPPEQRANSLVAPASLVSLPGAVFIASGGVPWNEWIVCLSAWCGFLALIMGAVLGLTLLMHRHWMEAERLPLPLGRGVGMLLGIDSIAIWRSPWFWGGLAVATAWCQLRYWAGHNPAIPDPSIDVPLASYFTDPSWSRMWGVTLSVHALFLGLALFFELNVLASMVVGFWLYRSMFWFGDATGFANGNPDFPWRYDLCAGAYLAYFVVILLMARRHLAGSLRRAVVGGWSREPGDPVSPRAAVLLLAACCLGALAWCWWVGVGVLGFSLLFAAFIVIGTVAARLRAECGILFGYFTPYSMAIVLGSLGGIPVFGPQVVLFGLVASMWMATCTMHIPGLQVEACELGRREGARPAAIIGVPLFAVVLGVLVGGWAFISLSSGQGGDNLRYSWAYDSKLWYFLGFNNEVSTLGQGKGSVFSAWGVSLGAGATMVTAALRQIFAGFWFHPVGILFGSTHLMDAVWGSCLAALVLRFAVVRMAGAGAVRERLLPAAIGIFLAGCLTYLVAFIHGTLLMGGAGFSQLVRSIP